MRSLFPKIELCRWDYLAIFICSIPAFYYLGKPAIYIFDEAVYANASWDMSHGSSWLLPTNPAYNTKPPLVLWMQAISLKIFPWTEFAIRFPSALSVTGILLLITVALKRWGFEQWARIIVMVCFIGNEGFIRHHVARTGDLDAVMTFFVIGYSIIVLDAIHKKQWSNTHFVWFFFMFILAYYSKSIAGWLMMGPLGIVWLLSPIRKVLVSIKFLTALFGSFLICLSYYFLRESLQPGYLSLMFHSEFLRMFSNVMPWHEHGFGYYFRNFVTLQTYTPWIYFLASAVGYSLFILKDQFIKTHLTRWIILGLGYLLLISIPADKLEWYDAPVFPFFAMIIGVVAVHLFRNISPPFKYLWVVPIAFLFWRKLSFICKDVLPHHQFENEGYMLRTADFNSSTKIFMKVEQPEHQLQLDFYRLVKKSGGYSAGYAEVKRDLEVLTSVDQVLVGDQIIISQQENL
ncbi:MAG: glycosyltransferase family 39 protein, partial [Saprospiraceae bacterium]